MSKNSECRKGSITPSTALLNQRLATFSKARMMIQYEIELLRQSKKGTAGVRLDLRTFNRIRHPHSPLPINGRVGETGKSKLMITTFSNPHLSTETLRVHQQTTSLYFLLFNALLPSVFPLPTRKLQKNRVRFQCWGRRA